MRQLPLLALAACSRVVSSAERDADIEDSTPWHPPPVADAGPADAYARRPCDAPALFADGLVPSRILHVKAGAVGGDGSAAAPFGSIGAAAAVATPGTFIRLEPGLHATNQFVPNLRGTASAPIWIGGAPGTRPIIADGSEALHLTNAAYVVVQNLEIRNQTANGINIDDGPSAAADAHHIAVVDVRVHDVSMSLSAQTCIRAAGVSDLAIYDSSAQRCSVGIDAIGVRNSVIARTTVRETVFGAIQVHGGSSDVDVRQNRIWDGGNAGVTLGGATPLYLFVPPPSTTQANAEARRVRAFDNILAGSTYAPFVIMGCVDCLVAHNLTYGTPGRLLRILQGTSTQGAYTFEPTSNGRVINNTFVWTSQVTGHVEDGDPTALATFTFSHDLWLWLNSPSQSTPRFTSTQTTVPDTGALIGTGTGYSASTLAELAAYCIGPEAGAAADLPEIDGTIEGFCRATGDQPTIGPQMQQMDRCLL